MRAELEQALEKFLRAALCLLLFLLPLKFGVPYLEQETFLFPYSVADWLLLPYWPIEFFNAAALLLFLVWGIKLFLSESASVRWNVSLTLAALFAGAVFFSSLFSSYPYASRLMSQQIFSCCLLFFLSIQLFAPEKGGGRAAALCLVAGGLLQAGYALYQHFWGLQETLEWIRGGAAGDKTHPNVLSRLEGKRAFGTFIYPNSLAGFFALALPVSFALWIEQIRRRRFPALLFPYPLLLLAALGVTFSKGGIAAVGLTAAAALFAYLILFKREGRSTAAWPWILGAAAIAAAVCAFLFFYRDFIAHRLHMSTFQERWGYWGAALKMLADAPGTGMGPGVFGALYPGYRMVGSQKTQLAHNDYLQIAAETGLPGFLLYAAFLGGILWAGLAWLRRQKEPARWVAGIYWGCFALAIHHFGDFDFYVPALGGTEWIFLGILCSVAVEGKTFAFGQPPLTARLLLFAGLIAGVAAAGDLLRTQLQARYAFDVARRSAKSGRPQEALLWAERAEQKEKGNALLRVFKGNLRLKSGDPEAALAEYRRAATLHPRWAVPRLLEARLWRAAWERQKTAENRDRAIRSWEEAVERNPGEPASRMELAQFLEKLGRMEPALIQYKAILKWNPRHRKAGERARELGRLLSEKFKDMG